MRPARTGQALQYHDFGRLPQGAARRRYGERHDRTQEVVARACLENVARQREGHRPRRRDHPEDKISFA